MRGIFDENMVLGKKCFILFSLWPWEHRSFPLPVSGTGAGTLFIQVSFLGPRSATSKSRHWDGTGNLFSWVLAWGPGSGTASSCSRQWDRDGRAFFPRNGTGPATLPTLFNCTISTTQCSIQNKLFSFKFWIWSLIKFLLQNQTQNTSREIDG